MKPKEYFYFALCVAFSNRDYARAPWRVGIELNRSRVAEGCPVAPGSNGTLLRRRGVAAAPSII